MQPQTQMASAVKPRAKARLTTSKPVVASAAPQGAFQNVNLEGNILKFTISPTHVSYANTLRRAIGTLVESIAFNADIDEITGLSKDVRISKNSTPMSNEMLAHRISLLPVYVAEPLKWNPDEYTFEIKVKNEKAEPIDITCSDITVYKKTGADTEPEIVPNTKFFPPNPLTGDTCLITVLKGKIGSQPAEELECVMRASIGIGKQNARHIPVSQWSYRYSPDTDAEKRKRIFDGWLVANKKIVPAELEKDEARKGELVREFNTMEADRCYITDENNEPTSFDFTVESIGVIPPAVIVARALEIIQAKCLAYSTINAGELPENLKIVAADARMRGFDFYFTGEDHTMGNLLQTWIDQKFMNDGDVSFVGYKIPHPLRDEMVLRLGIEKGDGKKDTARAIIARAAKECADQFGSWRAAWAGVAI
jgi:DNA-directed RNA polymerase subunit L